MKLCILLIIQLEVIEEDGDAEEAQVNRVPEQLVPELGVQVSLSVPIDEEGVRKDHRQHDDECQEIHKLELNQDECQDRHEDQDDDGSNESRAQQFLPT